MKTRLYLPPQTEKESDHVLGEKPWGGVSGSGRRVEGGAAFCLLYTARSFEQQQTFIFTSDLSLRIIFLLVSFNHLNSLKVNPSGCSQLHDEAAGRSLEGGFSLTRIGGSIPPEDALYCRLCNAGFRPRYFRLLRWSVSQMSQLYGHKLGQDRLHVGPRPIKACRLKRCA